jgi:hypothetical protein
MRSGNHAQPGRQFERVKHLLIANSEDIFVREEDFEGRSPVPISFDAKNAGSIQRLLARAW